MQLTAQDAAADPLYVIAVRLASRAAESFAPKPMKESASNCELNIVNPIESRQTHNQQIRYGYVCSKRLYIKSTYPTAALPSKNPDLICSTLKPKLEIVKIQKTVAVRKFIVFI
jgi:hypothetical protein